MKRVITGRATCDSLLSLIAMGRAKVIKEHTPAGTELVVRSASGALIGVVGDNKHRYRFEAALIKQGSGDGLFDGHSQTTNPSGVE